MIQLLRLFKGYILFCAQGGFPERFINLCQLKGVVLWNVKNDGVKVYACTPIVQYNEIISAAENSGMELSVIKEKGLKTFIKRNKSRVGVFVGIIFVTLFLFFMSGFIWEVEIADSSAVNVYNFTEELAEYGVKIGARKAGIDIQEVQKKLMENHSDLLWVSLNIFGGKAHLELTFVEPQEDIIDTHTPVNIVASKNGEIILVRGLYGVNAVKEGVNVTEGSLLIAGIGKYADGTEYFIHAKGDVLARTKNLISNTSCRNGSCFTVSSSESSYALVFFGLKIPLSLKKSAENVSSHRIMAQTKNAVLPIGVERNDCFAFVKGDYKFTKQESTYQAYLETVLEKRRDYGEVKFEKIDYTVKENGDSLEVNCKIRCVENIAKEVKISVDE